LRLRTVVFDALAARAYGAKTSQEKLADHLGLDPATLSQLRCGHRQPSPKFIATALASFPGTRFEDIFEWIVTGNGPSAASHNAVGALR
jgi:transcriptional regulator with XRE-family HTH domain